MTDFAAIVLGFTVGAALGSIAVLRDDAPAYYWDLVHTSVLWPFLVFLIFLLLWAFDVVSASWVLFFGATLLAWLAGAYFASFIKPFTDALMALI